MMRSARHAFSLLRDCLARMREAEGRPADPEAAERDALFVWSTIHGLSGVLHSHTLPTLGLSAAVLDAAAEHTLHRIGDALSAPAEGRPRDG